MDSTVTTLGANYLVHSRDFYRISRLKVCTVASVPKGMHATTRYRYYSTSKPDSPSSDLPLVPIFTIKNLNNKDCIKSSRLLLKDKGGIYSFINTVNGNQYIGSAKDFYLRLNEHLENKKSNLALQKAFAKYGLDQLKFCIYEYFTYESKIISHKALTDLETSYINRGQKKNLRFFFRPLNFDNLYNFKSTATSSLGYKHTEEARLKMVDYYKDKINHPSPYLSFFRDRGFGKTHTEEALAAPLSSFEERG